MFSGQEVSAHWKLLNKIKQKLQTLLMCLNFSANILHSYLIAPRRLLLFGVVPGIISIPLVSLQGVYSLTQND